MPLSRVNLILVEDDDVDVESVTRVLRRSGMGAPAAIFRDGQQALDALRSEPGAALKNRPLLILLDLSMPRCSGLEFLERLRRDPELQSTTVFVLTQSERAEDVAAAYEHQVAGYLVKSNMGENYTLLPELLVSYCTLVALQPVRR